MSSTHHYVYMYICVYIYIFNYNYCTDVHCYISVLYPPLYICSTTQYVHICDAPALIYTYRNMHTDIYLLPPVDMYPTTLYVYIYGAPAHIYAYRYIHTDIYISPPLYMWRPCSHIHVSLYTYPYISPPVGHRYRSAKTCSHSREEGGKGASHALRGGCGTGGLVHQMR